jgi:hypothetical protein
MRMPTRVAVVLVILAVALGAKTALFAYLQAAGPLPSVPLAGPLQAFPLELQRWAGRDLPVTDPRVLYGDDHLCRLYCCGGRQQEFRLWMVYSAAGEDRGHHPEVCLRAAGMPEDPRGRATVPAEGHPQPIQQYRFGSAGGGAALCGFYWYYTLLPPRDDGASPWQRAYQQRQRRPSSLTIEVFTRAVAEQDLEAARDFVRAVDRAIQASLPSTAVRGSAPLPVLLVDEGGIRSR